MTLFDYVSYRLRPVVRYRRLRQEGKLLRVVVELPVIDFVFFVVFASVGKGCHTGTVCVVAAVECRAIIGAIAMAMVIAVSVVIAMVVVEDVVLAAGVMDGGILALVAAGFLTGAGVQNGFTSLH